MGYIGTRRVVIEQVQQLIMQIAAFQSYHDVQFITIFREEEKQLWEWSKWLPHNKIKALIVVGLCMIKELVTNCLHLFIK